jgi:hypothetical protein
MTDDEAHFIGEEITVEYDRPPMLEKTPTCPDRFLWRDERFEVVEVLHEWRDYSRRGRMAKNMKPTHLDMAAKRGSWGVGRFYFQVRTANNRSFELYYDRAPKGSDKRKGAWFLFQELPANG